MSINDLAEKVKPFYTLFLCIVIASIFFALGLLSATEEKHTPIRVIQPENNQPASAISEASSMSNVGENGQTGNADAIPTANDSGGQVVGSRNGTKYFFPWCGSAKMIKPENLVTFTSVEAARQAGYSPAGNCKGLK